VINFERSGHNQVMPEATLLVEDTEFSLPEESLAGVPAKQRFATLLDDYYDFVWRGVRRLGVTDADAEDATLQVFEIASRKLDSIRTGCERAFLFQAALRVASDYRRASRRRRDSDLTELEDPADPSPLSDELLEIRRARAELDRILDTMPLELRTVFVLHELEQSAMSEIATLVGVPAGTVASRLRRARQLFREGLEQLAEPLALGGHQR
jgi:RNA polymerase sigma-70 factor (ECF subfamily)